VTKKITLIGCGNVGSRHLQALAKLPFDIDVNIVEPSKDAQDLAKTRLNEVQKKDTNNKFSWYESIKELGDSSDLAIVATTAIDRVKILNELLELGEDKFLVEKMVCQSTNEYDSLLTKMKHFKAKGWVNTNLRYFKSWQNIKKYFEDSEFIHLSVIASNISALGTNAIHYIDLFSFLTNDYNIKLNGDFLLNKLYPNKRGKHLKEFAGSLFGSIKSGSSLAITFIPDCDLPNILNIAGNHKHLMIDELNEKMFDLTNKNDQEFQFKFEHPSSLTTKIAKDIIEKDDCDLTTIENSYNLHAELFRILNAHIKKLTNEDVKLCPIT